MNVRFASTLATAITLSLLLTTNASAEDDNNEAKYRQAVMNAMGSQFGALAMIFSKRVDRPEELQIQAEALALSASLTAGLFPPGSEGGDALPAIWAEPDKVDAAAKKNAKTTAALAKAAAGGDMKTIAAAFKKAGASCKACHESYKAEDD
jgi:cytochrome c556